MKRWDDAMTCGMTAFRIKGRKKTKEKTRSIYQKTANTARYERLFRRNELPKAEIGNFKPEDLQNLLSNISETVKGEFQILLEGAEKTTPGKTIDKYALALWVWKKLSTVRIPQEKFVYIQKLIETGKIEYSLVNYPSLMERIKQSGIVRPALQSAGKKRHGLWALDYDKFYAETYDSE